MADLSMFDLTDRVAIVTGGGNGIGKAIAFGYARAGARLGVIDKMPGRADATAAAIGELGRDCVYDTGDVGYQKVAESFVKRVVDRFGRVDILVNCAGGMRTPEGLYYEKPFEEIDEEELDAVLRNNVKSAYFMCRAVGRTMLKQGKGSVINVTSINAQVPSPRRIPYGISKAGVSSFTKSLAAEWGPKGVRVNEIMPLAVTRPQEARYQDADNVKRIVERSMIKRLGRAEDHVGVAIFLASDASEWVCGATYRCDGGGWY